MVASMRDLRAFNASYHRNGGADSFTLCSFFFLRGKNTTRLTAVVNNNLVAVFDPYDMQERYDGEYFRKALLGSIAAMEKNNSDKLYERKEQ